MSQPFDAWSFCRDAISRGTAIERHCEAQGLGYESLSARMDAAASEFANRLKPHLAAGTSADDAEPTTADWLEAVGFTVCHTHADIEIDTKKGWTLFLRVRFFSMEASICHTQVDLNTSDGLALTRSNLMTRGDVRRLCSALGVQLKESA